LTQEHFYVLFFLKLFQGVCVIKVVNTPAKGVTLGASRNSAQIERGRCLRLSNQFLKLEELKMFRKISILCLVLFISMFSAGTELCYADEEEEIYRAKENICSLIDKGKFAEAKSLTEKMAIEFAGQQRLPGMFYWVAERYERNDQFDKAQLFYQRVVHDYPENQYADKAGLNSSKSNVMALIMSERYDEAKAALDKHSTDFASHPDLPRSLFWIAERYQRVDKFDEAKQIYQRVIEDYPNNSYLNKARLWLSRTNVSSLIVSGNYAGAQETLDKLVADFAGSGDLPENLFWITERYERQARLEEAKQNYQRIIQQFPYSSWAKRAKLGISRAEAIFLVESGDFNQANETINKMTADFAQHSDLPWSLYLVAERYKKINKTEDANRIYQQIVQNYPNSLYAGKAGGELGNPQEQETQKQYSAEAEKAAVELYRLAREYEEQADKIALARQTYERIVEEYPGTLKADIAVLDIRRTVIMEKLKAGDINQAKILIDNFVNDFKGHSRLPESIVRMAEDCYKTASLLQQNNQWDSAETRQYLNMTLKMLGIALNESPASYNVSKPLYLAGNCYYRLGEYQKSADTFQKVIDNYPDFEAAWNALFLVAESYQGLKRTGLLSASQADSQTLAAYNRLLQTYPDCPVATDAKHWIEKQKTE
jgi:TolA-binding protein